MCGIAGFVGAPGEGLTALRGWGELLAHRGPDDLGLGVLAPAGFGSGRDPACIGADAQVVLWHRRLSILDLSEAGWQPMSSADQVADAVLHCIERRREEIAVPGQSGRLATVAYVFPELAKALRPMLQKKGKKAKAAYIAKKRG